MTPTFPKPKDSYSVFDLNLSGDYSIDALKIIPLDENARINEEVLASNLKVINDRLVQLRNDFNSIKDTFYFGNSSGTSTKYKVIASVDDGDDYSVQVVTKSSSMISKSNLPSTQQADITSKAVGEVQQAVTQASSTLADKIAANQATIEAAQQGDANAQSALDSQVKESKSLIQTLREKLKAANPNLDI